MITPSQIRERKLSTVEVGGYDRGEVNELLLEILESYEAVYAENKELYRKMEVLANRIEEYRADEDSIKTALITAQKMASQVVSEAKEKAEKAISDSASSAQSTVMDAKQKADKIIGEARDYVADLTKDKEKAAEAIVFEAQQKANDAINGAKVVAQSVLDRAKTLSEEIVEKAKQEKEYHEGLTAKLRDESKSFKDSLISLYEAQLDGLKSMIENEKSDTDKDDDGALDEIKSELDALISNIDDITAVSAEYEKKNDDAKAEAEEEAEVEAEADEAEEAEEVEIAEETETEAQADEAENAERTQELKNSEDDEVDEIIGELENADTDDFEEIAEDDEISEEDVDKAIDAFSSDELTPVDDTAIPVIEDEPEFESRAMPFESYFHVNKEDPHNTDETISLIPPDDDEDDEPPKFKGFFKKKK